MSLSVLRHFNMRHFLSKYLYVNLMLTFPSISWLPGWTLILMLEPRGDLRLSVGLVTAPALRSW